MRYLDVTLPIGPGLPRYDGDPAVELTSWSSRAQGADFNVTALRLGSHTGTHVDVPAHCVDGGGTVDALPLDLLCGPAFVLDVAGAPPATSGGVIAIDMLGELPQGCERLLLRTHAGGYWPSPGGSAGGLDLDAARLLVRRGVRLVGIDRLSIAPPNAELAVHRLLLAAGIAVIEGLDLAEVRQGSYDLLCLPLKLAGIDGAPARVVLVER